MLSDNQDQQVILPKRLACAAAALPLALLCSCAASNQKEMFQSSLPGEIIRITEEPWRPQHESNRSLDDITDELFRRTTRRFEYVPSLSYSHAIHMLVAGEVDLVLSSVYAASLVKKSKPDIAIIAVESPSASSALITSKTGTNPNTFNDSMTGLERIRGLRVGFGSRYAGLGFRNPLQQMAKLKITLDDLHSCTFIPDQGLLVKNVTAGRLDYAFIRLSKDGQARRKPSPNDYNVAWLSPPQRDFVILAGNRLQHPKNSRLRQQLIVLFSNLSTRRENDRKILDAMQVQALEAPSSVFVTGLPMRLAKFDVISPNSIQKKCY